MNSRHKAFPYPVYYAQVVGLTLLGLLTSLYLAYTHYKNHTDLNFASFCALSRAVNCDTVAQSPWAIFWDAPVAAWGIAAYLFFLLLLIPLRHRTEGIIAGWSFVTVAAVLASCCSVYLAVLSTTKIHSWCILCVATYAVNFLLAFASWITFRRFSTIGFFHAVPAAFKVLTASKVVRYGTAVLAVSFLATRFFLPAYWVQEPIPLQSNVATGVTAEGFPWIGAENPQLVIEEFTDYQCFQCRKVHFYLRQLVNQNPERIRLVHRHFPLDHEFNRILVPTPFHVGSGRLALLAIVAAEHGAFWAVNDALYDAMQSKQESVRVDAFAALMHISPKELATAMYSKKNLKHLQHDIVQGMQYGITGTPSFVIEGKMYGETLPTELLQKLTR